MDIQFIMFRENGERRSFPLSGDRNLIGRQEDCDIRIPLPEVSRKHAEITIQDKTLKIKDLGSANGTYVNNKRIKESEISAGDRLIIGPVVFTVQIDGQPEKIKPVKTKLSRRTVFSPEDDLTASLDRSGSGSAPGVKLSGSANDMAALDALNTSGDPEGSSLAIDLEDEIIDMTEDDEKPKK